MYCIAFYLLGKKQYKNILYAYPINSLWNPINHSSNANHFNSKPQSSHIPCRIFRFGQHQQWRLQRKRPHHSWNAQSQHFRWGSSRRRLVRSTQLRRHGRWTNPFLSITHITTYKKRYSKTRRSRIYTQFIFIFILSNNEYKLHIIILLSFFSFFILF